MQENPFALEFKKLPKSLPVFPLIDAFLLPGGQLPLNVFEPRYLDLVNDALKGDRLIGMIQPKEGEVLHDTGCAGKVVEFSETQDGRYLITLCGTYRFKVAKEIKSKAAYRSVKPDWTPFKDDHTAHKCLGLNREKLTDLLRIYFKDQGMDCDWNAIADAPDGKLITCLSMICPFDAREKQALLEAPCCKSRAELFMGMLEISVQSLNHTASSQHH